MISSFRTLVRTCNVLKFVTELKKKISGLIDLYVDNSNACSLCRMVKKAIPFLFKQLSQLSPPGEEELNRISG